MPELHEFWDPNEWEDHALGLLHDRHGAVNVMKVPARHKGDFGVDYYCLMDRVAYQCCAVQEPCEVADRASKQKAKITTDLVKFCTRSGVAVVFSGLKISRWILLVPIHDSAQVNIHLTAKTGEARQKGLPYVADDFEVLMHDLDCFDAASRQARAALMNPLIFQRPEFGRFFSLRSGNNRTKRTNWHPAALLTTIAFVHSHAAGLAQRASIS